MLRHFSLKTVRRSFKFLGSGVMLAAAMPPFFIWPLLFIAMPVWARGVASSRSLWRAFGRGWLVGMGFYTAGLYWIANALLVHADAYWWAVPFAAVGLPAFLASITGAASMAMWWSHRRLQKWGLGRLGHAQWFVLPVLAWVAWGVTEGARAIILGGFPWLLIVHAIPGNAIGLPWLQALEPLGSYGLSAVVLAVALLPWLGSRMIRRRAGRMGIIVVFLPFMVMAGGWYWGQQQLSHWSRAVASAPDIVTVRMVQPNIPQTEKWQPRFRTRNLGRLTDMTRMPNPDHDRLPDLIIWPETSIAMIKESDKKIWRGMAAQMLAKGQVLMLGALVSSEIVNSDGHASVAEGYVWNSLRSYDHNGRLLSHYAKHQLVPFGETLPFQDYWPFDPIAAGAARFGEGRGVVTQTVPAINRDQNIRFSPLVCYEVVFPHKVVATGAERPQVLVNVTNDAWYGHSSGPYQHAHIARLRAIEERLPMIRVANTGISTIVDPSGRVMAQIDLGVQGIADVDVPLGASLQ